MKKPVRGKKKQVQQRNARKRFRTVKERANRRKKYQDHLKYKARLEREYYELLNQMMMEQMSEIPSEEGEVQTNDTNEALFDGEESDDK